VHIYSSDQLGPSVLRIAARPVLGAYFVLYLKKMTIKQEISFCAAIPAKALSVRRLYIAVGAPGAYASPVGDPPICIVETVHSAHAGSVFSLSADIARA
jgi:hypothetical protein